jgi:hypothetical protein
MCRRPVSRIAPNNTPNDTFVSTRCEAGRTCLPHQRQREKTLGTPEKKSRIAAGSPVSLEPTARMVYEVMSYSSKMFNLAFCLGATIFYALLFRARTVARPLSLRGLVSVQGVFAGVLLGLFGVNARGFSPAAIASPPRRVA